MSDEAWYETPGDAVYPEPIAEKDDGLSMPEILLPETSRNGRPFSSHDRHLAGDPARNISAQFARDNHIEHVQDYNALCMVCGCCWCCDDDCCAEYICPNPDCGCSDKPSPTCVLPPERTEP